MFPASDIPRSSRSSAPSQRRRRALIEIAISYGLILAVLWTPRPWQQLLWWIAVLVTGILIGLSYEGRFVMGLRARNFFRPFWIVAAAMLVSAVAVAISARLHTLHGPRRPLTLVEGFWVYAIWSGVQQFLLQCFFLSRLLRLLPSPRLAAFAAAGLFAFAHLPNPVLVVLTIVWGTVACLVYLRYCNLFPLAIAHAILGITLAVVVPGHVDHNMRVGLGYLKYHRGEFHPRMGAHPTATAAESKGSRSSAGN